MQGELLALRLVHVLGGIFWVGSALFMALFLFPALASAGPAAGQVMGAMQRRRIFTILPAVAALTLLSGVRLMQLTSDGFSAAYFNSPSGRVFAWGGTFAIAAFVIGMVFARPTGLKLGKLGALPPSVDVAEQQRRDEERGRLQRLVMVFGVVNLVLLLLAAAAMAMARYV
jgi:uncharacterized membrane protein